MGAPFAVLDTPAYKLKASWRNKSGGPVGPEPAPRPPTYLPTLTAVGLDTPTPLLSPAGGRQTPRD